MDLDFFGCECTEETTILPGTDELDKSPAYSAQIVFGVPTGGDGDTEFMDYHFYLFLDAQDFKHCPLIQIASLAEPGFVSGFLEGFVHPRYETKSPAGSLKA
jgi:hypothetical protein